VGWERRGGGRVGRGGYLKGRGHLPFRRGRGASAFECRVTTRATPCVVRGPQKGTAAKVGDSGGVPHYCKERVTIAPAAKGRKEKERCNRRWFGDRCQLVLGVEKSGGTSVRLGADTASKYLYFTGGKKIN